MQDLHCSKNVQLKIVRGSKVSCKKLRLVSPLVLVFLSRSPAAGSPPANLPSPLCARQAANSESTCVLQSQKRRPVNEREGVRAGKRSLSFVSQVEPEVRSLSARCPLLVLPGTSPVGGGEGTGRGDETLMDSQLVLESELLLDQTESLWIKPSNRGRVCFICSLLCIALVLCCCFIF